MRTCPYCGGELAPGARKCRHCGEWVVPPAQRGPLYGKSAPSAERNTPSPYEYTITEEEPSQPQQYYTRNPRPYRPSYRENGGISRREPAGFFETYFFRAFFGEYSRFDGYLNRRDFWLSMIAAFILTMGLTGIVFIVNWFLIPMAQTIIWWSVGLLWGLILFVPFFGLSSRRLRDAGLSPYCNFLVIIPGVGNLLLAILWLLPEKREHAERPFNFNGADTLLTLLSVGLLIIGMCFASGTFGYYGSNAPDYDTIGDSIDEESLFMTDTVIERSEVPVTEQPVATAPVADSTVTQTPEETPTTPTDPTIPYDTTRYY